MSDPAGRGPPGPAWTVFACAALLALGVVLGGYGAFLSPAGPRVGTSPPLSVGVLFGVIGNVVAAWLALAVTRSRGLAVLPLAAWLVTVLFLGTNRPNGSIALIGGGLTVPTLLFEGLGALAGAVAVLALPIPGRPRQPARPDRPPPRRAAGR